MAAPKLRPCALLLIVAVASVASQTFQYSRGWTNGKRAGHSHSYSHRRPDDIGEIASSLDRVLSPCQMKNLRYILEGKPFNDRLFARCDYVDEDTDIQPKTSYSGSDRNPELLDAYL